MIIRVKFLVFSVKRLILVTDYVYLSFNFLNTELIYGSEFSEQKLFEIT